MRTETAIYTASALCAGIMFGCAADKGAESPTDVNLIPLVAHWAMEDTTGRKMQDATGHGHDGAIIGSASLSDGVSGKALSLGGSGMGIDVPDDSAFGFRGGFTLCLSFKMETFPAGQGILFFRGDSRPGLDPFQLSVHSDNSSLRFSIIGNPTGLTGDSSVSVYAPVKTGQWNRVDAVFDTTGDNSVALYVNGTLAEKKSTSIVPLVKLDPGENPGIGIGHHARRVGGDYAFKGQVDEVRVYSGPLASGTITSGKY